VALAPLPAGTFFKRNRGRGKSCGMTKDEIEKINRECLARWAQQLADGHSTPLLVIGIGHDERAGELHVVTLENAEFDNRTLAAYAAHAVGKLMAMVEEQENEKNLGG